MPRMEWSVKSSVADFSDRARSSLRSSRLFVFVVAAQRTGIGLASKRHNDCGPRAWMSALALRPPFSHEHPRIRCRKVERLSDDVGGKVDPIDLVGKLPRQSNTHPAIWYATGVPRRSLSVIKRKSMC